MKPLLLADLEKMNIPDVREHIANEYFSDDYPPNKKEVDANIKMLMNYDILIAYESVGSWGCDSSSFFLFKEKKSGKLYELHGSHCSCYGFEGQFKLEPTTIKALKARTKKDGHIFYAGGYDDQETQNQALVREFVLSL